MLKKIIKGLAIGGAALAIAATSAQADGNVVEANIYGASAQYKFWTKAAPAFLVDQGCAATDVYFAHETKLSDSAKGMSKRDAGIAVCNGSVGGTAVGNGINGDKDTYIIRYTTSASAYGLRAVAAASGSEMDEDGVGFDKRYQPSIANNTLVAYGSTTSGDIDPVNGMTAQEVTVGASDVAAETFLQYSEGELLGHLPSDDGYVVKEIIYPDFLLDDEDPAKEFDAVNRLKGMTYYRPVVVPFNFFANRGGEGNPEDGPQTDVTPVPFTNMTRLMAVSIFSGSVANWNEFSDDAALDLPIVVCMRHAGSGTVATLNAAIMRNDAFLVEYEDDAGDPRVFFNKGSSDMMRCVGQNAGAVGYADTDKCKSNCTDKEDDYGKVLSMTYNGSEGKSVDIRKGVHEFWSAQWLYSKYNVGTANGDLVKALNDFASDGTKLPLTGKEDYWAAQGDMGWSKSTDFSYPLPN